LDRLAAVYCGPGDRVEDEDVMNHLLPCNPVADLDPSIVTSPAPRSGTRSVRSQLYA